MFLRRPFDGKNYFADFNWMEIHQLTLHDRTLRGTDQPALPHRFPLEAGNPWALPPSPPQKCVKSPHFCFVAERGPRLGVERNKRRASLVYKCRLDLRGFGIIVR